MKRLLFIFILAFFVLSCSKDKKAEIPADIIPPDQMVMVLVDFHLAEASLIEGRNEGQVISINKDFYFYSILQKYQISYKKFNQSLKFYCSNLEELDLIYKDVITELSKTQSRIGSRGFP